MWASNFLFLLSQSFMISFLPVYYINLFKAQVLFLPSLLSPFFPKLPFRCGKGIHQISLWIDVTLLYKLISSNSSMVERNLFLMNLILPVTSPTFFFSSFFFFSLYLSVFSSCYNYSFTLQALEDRLCLVFSTMFTSVGPNLAGSLVTALNINNPI